MAEARRPHFSSTSLNMIHRCGVQYAFRYLEGIKSPPGIAMLIGKGTGMAVEQDLKHKMAEGELLTLDQVKDAARDAVNSEWLEEEPVLTKEEKEKGAATVKGETVDTCVTLAALHHNEIAPGIEPIAVEHAWRVEIPQASHDLIGFMDVLEEGRVRDLKTKAKKPSQNDMDRDLQLSTYALAHKVTRGTLPELYFDVLLKKKKPEAITLKTTRDADDLRQLIDRFLLACDVVKGGVFMPAPTDSWMCSKKWCGYWDKCSFGRKGKRTVGYGS